MKNKPYPLYELPAITDLRDLIDKRMQKNPEGIAFSYREKKEIIKITCRQFKESVEKLGTYLLMHGCHEMHIAIVGENSYDWVLAFMAITNSGNVAVPVPKDLEPEAINKMIVQTDCEMVFCSAAYIHKLEFVNEEIQKFSFKEMNSFLEEGEQAIQSGRDDYANVKIDPDQLAAIFFTSGTSGDSKGVMLSHKNIASDINIACRNFVLEGDTAVFLPFHHCLGLITAVLKVFNYNHCVFINSSLKHIPRDLKEIKPQTVFLVPLFIETFHKEILKQVKKENKEKKLKRGERLSQLLLCIGIDKRKVFFRDIHDFFGGNLEYIICGGAYLDQKYIDEFQRWGITILNGYGITECSPVVSVNRNHYQRKNSVGLILPGLQVKAAEDGEILIKGENVMLGYYKDPEATAAVLKDGWYSTGDLGRVDEDGFLYITGRKKSLIILSNGENVAAETIENKVMESEGVAETVAYSENGRIIAEVYPEEEYLNNTEYFETVRKKLNSKMPAGIQISEIRLRNTEFEKNVNHKIVRRK